MRGLLVFTSALLSFGLLWWGGHNLYVAIRNRAPVEITCTDFVNDRPSARWLRLTRCQADLDNLVYERDSQGSPAVVYVPLRPQGVTHGPAEIAIKRDDQDALDAINLGNLAALQEPGEGLVEPGSDLNDEARRRLRGLGLTNDFVIVDRDAKPRFWLALAVFAAGLLAVGLGVRVLFVRRLARRPG